jgi:hypothetical protein
LSGVLARGARIVFGAIYGAPNRIDQDCLCSKLRNAEKAWRLVRHRHTVVGMITILSALAFPLCFRVRRRASLELEFVALRHQVVVLRRRQRPGRLSLFSTDRLLWVWLCRIWPQALNVIVLVKPATVILPATQTTRAFCSWRAGLVGVDDAGDLAAASSRLRSAGGRPTRTGKNESATALSGDSGGRLEFEITHPFHPVLAQKCIWRWKWATDDRG